jgi:FtsP/CotA-like multicopper oxidase with cupredoxin domain
MIGKMLEFRVVNATPSVDQPGFMLTRLNSCGPNDRSQVPAVLTEQIPIVAPTRTRLIEFGRSGGGDSRDPLTGECTPDCPEFATFPWSVKIDGQDAHTFNANRISLLIPEPGAVEHWTLVNGGGGWDHPIHLHFEEGVTMDRGGDAIPATEHLVRKDVWRLRESGTVRFQVRFGEYGGSYVNHCHNTVHEDFAMLLRLQILAGAGPQAVVTPTPNPTLDGVFFTTPEILPEATGSSQT